MKSIIEILNEEDKVIKVLDHANGSSLDNRKSNLRMCTAQENSRNAVCREDNISGYRGVTFRPETRGTKKYQARIRGEDGKRISLGYFTTAAEAGEAYANASKLLHKDYSNTQGKHKCF